MKRKILGVIMVALVLIFGVQLFMEQLFRTRLLEMTQTMAQTPGQMESDNREQELFVIFGIDQKEGDAGRSDCVLLASLEESGKLRLCSIARDTLVTLPDTGEETKLGHAYALGGPELAIRTLNENFGLEVEQYVSVNFSQLSQIVDLLGGVELQLSEEEWRYLELGKKYLGVQRLSGAQALSYSRIRSIDNDVMRMERHRKLVLAMIRTLGNVEMTRFPELVVEGMSCCRTNVDILTAMRWGKVLLKNAGNLEPESICLPGNAVTAWGGIRPDGVWYYVYDLDKASEEIRDFFQREPGEK